jgi:hypothetical protein
MRIRQLSFPVVNSKEVVTFYFAAIPTRLIFGDVNAQDWLRQNCGFCNTELIFNPVERAIRKDFYESNVMWGLIIDANDTETSGYGRMFYKLCEPDMSEYLTRSYCIWFRREEDAAMFKMKYHG